MKWPKSWHDVLVAAFLVVFGLGLGLPLLILMFIGTWKCLIDVLTGKAQ